MENHERILEKGQGKNNEGVRSLKCRKSCTAKLGTTNTFVSEQVFIKRRDQRSMQGKCRKGVRWHVQGRYHMDTRSFATT